MNNSGRADKTIQRHEDSENFSYLLQITHQTCGGKRSQLEFLNLLLYSSTRLIGDPQNILIIYTIQRDLERKVFVWPIPVWTKCSDQNESHS